MRYAAANEFDAVVILVDEDGDRKRIHGVDLAQQSKAVTTARACGLAIRTFDTWMLADEKALSHALGKTVQRQKDPERLTNPKELFQSLHKQHKCELSQTQAYVEIAKAIDLDQLAERCPKGFGVFRDRIKSMITDAAINGL